MLTVHYAFKIIINKSRLLNYHALTISIGIVYAFGLLKVMRVHCAEEESFFIDFY